jgi:hypothetical protein
MAERAMAFAERTPAERAVEQLLRPLDAWHPDVVAPQRVVRAMLDYTTPVRAISKQRQPVVSPTVAPQVPIRNERQRVRAGRVRVPTRA